MIDASGGVLDQDYEMFEQQTPHLLIEHEYWTTRPARASGAAGSGVETEFITGSDKVKLVTFGDGDVEPSRGAQGGMDGALNIIQLTYPGRRGRYPAPPRTWWSTCPRAPSTSSRPAAAAAGAIPSCGPPRRCCATCATAWSPSRAPRRDYGVVIDPETWTVDEGETARRLRSVRGPIACTPISASDTNRPKEEWS